MIMTSGHPLKTLRTTMKILSNRNISFVLYLGAHYERYEYEKGFVKWIDEFGRQPEGDRFNKELEEAYQKKVNKEGLDDS